MVIDEAYSNDIFRVVFDIIPSIVLIVDEDIRIIEFNRAAAEFVGAEGAAVLKTRGGEVLHCLHASDVPNGCGHGPICSDCVMRNSVSEAFNGDKVVRRRHEMELIRNEKVTQIHSLISAGQFLYQKTRLVLLIIEDISEIIELRDIIPICAVCGKVRNDNDYWMKVESYFHKHMGIDFSHGLCPGCFQIEMRKLGPGHED